MPWGIFITTYTVEVANKGELIRLEREAFRAHLTIGHETIHGPLAARLDIVCSRSTCKADVYTTAHTHGFS